MKTFEKKNRFEGFSSKTFGKKSFWSFEIQNPSEKNRFDYLISKILRKKIDLKVMTFAQVYTQEPLGIATVMLNLQVVDRFY